MCLLFFASRCVSTPLSFAFSLHLVWSLFTFGACIRHLTLPIVQIIADQTLSPTGICYLLLFLAFHFVLANKSKVGPLAFM
uniref:Secreted protein n=1 Tax=Panagrellus redivivus TaxID=6233 RepID=A0A7E4V3C7_PANRE